MEKIKALYLNVKEGKLPELIELNADESNLDTFHKLLDCDTIDIVSRPIGGRLYRFICDDEALIKGEDLFLAYAYFGEQNYSIYGNIIVCNPAPLYCPHDFVDITHDDVLFVSRYMHYTIGPKGPHFCIVGGGI